MDEADCSAKCLRLTGLSQAYERHDAEQVEPNVV